VVWRSAFTIASHINSYYLAFIHTKLPKLSLINIYAVVKLILPTFIPTNNIIFGYNNYGLIKLISDTDLIASWDCRSAPA
jgi:hypothetical protein